MFDVMLTCCLQKCHKTETYVIQRNLKLNKTNYMYNHFLFDRYNSSAVSLCHKPVVIFAYTALLPTQCNVRAIVVQALN